MTEENYKLYTKNDVQINGRKLSDKEATALYELAYGAVQHSIQSEGFLEDECGIEKEEQKKIVSKLLNMFNSEMTNEENDGVEEFLYMNGNELIELLNELKQIALEENYDDRFVALINLVVNNGDVVEELVEDLNE